MASITRRLLLQSKQCPSRIRVRASPKNRTQWQRPLTTTSIRYAKEPAKEGSYTAAAAKAPAEQLEEMTTGVSDETPRSREFTKMSPEERESAMVANLQASLSELDPDVVKDAIRKGKQGIPFAKDYELENDEDFDIEEDDPRKASRGFWAEGEPSMGIDEDYYGDDITSHGHGELQQHRELRDYARLIAWELPLLSHLAQPFEPPTSTTPFRFRYTSYLGESHPASNKVVVEFSPTDLPSLTPLQISKMIKLSGPRYNPSTGIVKMACESCDTQAQNKRFLGETIQSLIAEAKDSKDTFEDVPFDFRHHKVKKRVEFPKEWVLTKERKMYLEGKREDGKRAEEERRENGKLIDGKVVVETSLPFVEQSQPEPVMVGGPRGRASR